MNLFNYTTTTTTTQRIPRASPTCSQCGMRGHNIRTCASSELMNMVRKLRTMVSELYPHQYIINWLQILTEYDLRLVLSNFTYSTYSTYIKYSKEKCITMLSGAITKQYSSAVPHILSDYISYLRRTNILTWIIVEDIPQLYMHYCLSNGHLYPDDLFDIVPSDEESALLCHSIITYTIPPDSAPHLIKRFQAFAIRMFRYHLYSNDDNEPTVVSNASPIKYEIISRNITEPVHIDCPICMEYVETPNVVSTTCDHQFCKDCIMTVFKQNTTQRAGCPMCRNPMFELFCGTL